MAQLNAPDWWELGCTFLIMLFTGLTAYLQYIQLRPMIFIKFSHTNDDILYLDLVIQNNSRKLIHITEIMPTRPFGLKISDCNYVHEYIPGKGSMKPKKPIHESIKVEIIVPPNSTESYRLYLSVENDFFIENTTLIMSLRILANSFTEKYKIIEVKTIIPMLIDKSSSPLITPIPPV